MVPVTSLFLLNLITLKIIPTLNWYVIFQIPEHVTGHNIFRTPRPDVTGIYWASGALNRAKRGMGPCRGKGGTDRLLVTSNIAKWRRNAKPTRTLETMLHHLQWLVSRGLIALIITFQKCDVLSCWMAAPRSKCLYYVQGLERYEGCPWLGQGSQTVLLVPPVDSQPLF
jgi:hypothetical protein